MRIWHLTHTPPLEVKIDVAGACIFMYGHHARHPSFNLGAQTPYLLARAPELLHIHDIADRKHSTIGRSIAPPLATHSRATDPTPSAGPANSVSVVLVGSFSKLSSAGFESEGPSIISNCRESQGTY